LYGVSLRFPLFSALAVCVFRAFAPAFSLFLLTTISLAADKKVVPLEKRVARPTTLHLTLDKAIQLALSKNFTLEVERFEPQIASQRVTQELGRFDPVLGMSASRSEQTIRDQFDGQNHFSITDITQTNRAGIGVSGTTFWGLDYDLSIGSTGRTGTFNSFDELFNSDANLTVRQPLLQGFGTDSNLANLRIARNSQLVSEWGLKQRVIDVITSTISTYNNLHLSMEALTVARGFRDLARQLLDDNIKREQIGVMSPLDITTARAEAASREEAVIVAERLVKDNANFLKQLITRDLERLLDVSVQIAPPPTPPFVSDVHGGIEDAINLRPDYRQSLLEIERRHITLAFAKDSALPRLDLEASLNLLGFDNDLGTSLNRVPKRDQTNWSIGAIFSVPIPNREGRGSVLAAQLSSAQSLVNLQRLEQQIVVDVDNANGAVITARERIESNEVARKLAEESLAAGEERLRVGRGTTFEVLELQKNLAEAQTAEIRARADYNKAVAEYHRQIGTTLKVHRVTLY
jgi:outer membrane protein TolC